MYQPGDKVAEHLELVRLLGAGGMGAVWVARHQRLRAQVAVKLLSASMLNNPAARSRFDREAQWVAQVKSPHVVQVLDQGVTQADPPEPYIVMELLEGEDLGSLLERAGNLPLTDTAYIIEQVCSGLSAAHAAGIVHRDIKPENIFLMRGDRPFVKLLDFGIARATQDVESKRLTQTGGVIGTAHYMSPEQLFEGKQVDHRSDIWALGVVTYRMLTGRLPFDGSTYGDLCLAVNAGVYTAASQIVPLPAEVDSLLAGALATDRGERLTEVKEFATALTALAQKQSGVSPLPLSASASGAVPAMTGERPATAAPEQLLTGAGASVTLASVPMNRSGALAIIALLGFAALGTAGFAAFKHWSPDSVTGPTKPPSSVEQTGAGFASSGVNASASADEPQVKTVSRALDASNEQADMKGSGSSNLKVAPTGEDPGGTDRTQSSLQKPKPVKPSIKQAPAAKAGRTPTSVSNTSKSTTPKNNDSATGFASATRTRTPPPPKEKYRGF